MRLRLSWAGLYRPATNAANAASAARYPILSAYFLIRLSAALPETFFKEIRYGRRKRK
jgi:hypothetical protein